MKPSSDAPTRESWLELAVEQLRPLFKGCGADLPQVRVSVGFPSRKALGKKSRAIGQCWDKSTTEDGTAQIFISPLLEEATGEGGVLSTLVHELVHAVVGCKANHGPKFGKLAREVGLEGPLPSCGAGLALCGRLDTIFKELGAYPHKKITPPVAEEKKQTTRMVKCECEACGYVARTTKKWLEIGPPHCPKHGAMFFQEPDEEGGEE